MSKKKESDFAEVVIDHLILQSIPQEKSLYYADKTDRKRRDDYAKIRSKVLWHIGRSLSPRQKEVIKLILQGKKETEIAKILGVTQQVVNIYKQRAINKLRKLINV